MTPDQRDRLTDRLCAAGMAAFFIGAGLLFTYVLVGW